MKLVYPEYSIEMILKENQVLVWVIEQPHAFSKIAAELWKQVQGETGDFILSEADKIYNISKEMDMIMNPFALSCNDRKIINKLYQELNELAINEFFEQTNELNSAAVKYLDELLSAVPYHLQFELQLDVSALLKLYGVAIETSGETLLEQLIGYMQIMHQVCRIRIFAIINLKQYFDEAELQGLYEFAFYEKIYLLIIEGKYTECYKNG